MKIKSKLRTPLLVALAVLLIDQISKWIITIIVPQNGAIALITNGLYLSNLRNTGAAFSILSGQNTLLIFVALAAAAVIVYYLKTEHRRFAIPLALILGGVLGNLLDRIRLGHVVDFVDFRIWPVFNLADSAITIGVILVIYQAYLKEKIEKYK